MLRGRFGDTTGRPYLEGRLLLPRQNLHQDISFLVDTGADCSYLMPLDAQVMGIDYSRLAGRSVAEGVGGQTMDFLEPAVLVFADDESVYIHEIVLRIGQPTTAMSDVPSLLGRDILDHWQMLYRPRDRRLEFEVLTALVVVPLPGGHESIAATPGRD